MAVTRQSKLALGSRDRSPEEEDFMQVCVCVRVRACACVRARERRRKKERQRDGGTEGGWEKDGERERERDLLFVCAFLTHVRVLCVILRACVRARMPDVRARA